MGLYLLAEAQAGAGGIMDIITSLLGGGGGNLLPLILIGVMFFMFMRKPAPTPTPNAVPEQLIATPLSNARMLVSELQRTGFLGLGADDMPILEWFLSLPADKQVAFVQAVMKKMQSITGK